MPTDPSDSDEPAPRADGGRGEMEADSEEAFDAAAGEQVDPMSFLLDAGVIVPCEDGSDLCLDADFESDWYTATEAFRDDPDRRRSAATTLFDLSDAVEIVEEDELLVLREDGRRVGSWVSDGALVSDLAAHEVIDDREAAWRDVWPEQRPRIVRGLRTFYSRCALCGGSIELTEETVASCRQTWDVYALRCGDCREHLLEIDPEHVEGAERDTVPGATEGGFRR